MRADSVQNGMAASLSHSCLGAAGAVRGEDFVRGVAHGVRASERMSEVRLDWIPSPFSLVFDVSADTPPLFFNTPRGSMAGCDSEESLVVRVALSTGDAGRLSPALAAAMVS